MVRAVYSYAVASLAIICVAAMTSCNSPEATLVTRTEKVNAPLPSPSRISPKTVTGGRNLAVYDLAGRKGCGNLANNDYRKCEASIQDARDFIWNHWTERRRGYVIITMASDDATSDAHIFVEPGDDGHWRVAWIWKRLSGFGDRGRTVAGDVAVGPDVRSIERKVLAETDVGCMRGGAAHLSFLDADGKEAFCL